MKTRLLPLTLLVMLLLSSCNLTSTPTPEDPMDTIRTAAAATVVAMTTQVMQTQMAIPNPMATPTAQVLTLPPLATPLVDPNQPTEAPEPDLTSTPSKACDLAEFVDETIPDGTKFPPATSFAKSWTLKNVGTCAWTTAYAAVFVKGDSMEGPAAQPITADRIVPGETVTINMYFTTSSSAGNYRAEYQLRNANGVLFSFNNPESTYWVDIEVTGSAVTAVPVTPQPFSSLGVGYCSAQWSSGLGNLPCPGKSSDVAGFVFSDNSPLLENGAEDDELGLWLGVQNVTNGYIKGVYPAVTIQPGQHFSAVIGCNRAQSDCDVLVSLNYIADGAENNLASWREVNDGEISKVSVDLNSLAGKAVQLVLKVESRGDPSGDMVLIMAPSLQ